MRLVYGTAVDWEILERLPSGEVRIRSRSLNATVDELESMLVAAVGLTHTSTVATLGVVAPRAFPGLSTEGTPHSQPSVQDRSGDARSGNARGSVLSTAQPSPERTANPITGWAGPTPSATGGWPLARLTDADTAHSAAHKARFNLSANQRLCLEAHAQAGPDGLSGEQLERVAGKPYQTVGPRRKALEACGYLVKAGVRVNSRGNDETIYCCTEAGFEAAR